MRLSTQLTIAMIVLVVATAMAIGTLIYRNVAALALPRTLDRIEIHTQLVAGDLENTQSGVRAFVVGLTSAGSLLSMMRAQRAGGADPADGLTMVQWKERLAARFMAELRARPDYLRVGFVGLTDDGSENVLADRSAPGGVIRSTGFGEINRHSDEFQTIMGLRSDEAYVSQIAFGRNGEFANSPPVISVAAPVRYPDGRLFGAVMVALDMRRTFARIRQHLLPGTRLYVVNQQGEYLIRYDGTETSGSERFTRFQDEFPQIANEIRNEVAKPQIIQIRKGERFGIGWSTARFEGGPPITVFEMMPYSQVMAAAIAVRDDSIAGGVLAILVAALVSTLLARSLTKPLAEMTRAVQSFSGGKPTAVLLRGSGEIRTLANAFSHMATEVWEKTEAVKLEVMKRRRTETDLQGHAERARLFSAAVESSSDAIVTETVDGTITGWNPGAERLLGYMADEVIGKPANIIVPEHLHSKSGEVLRRISTGKEIEDYESVRIRKDGRQIDVSISVAPVKSDSGEIVGVAFAARDITAKKRVLHALLESEQLARGIVAAAPDAFIQFDENGKIVDWNPAAEAMFGWIKHEVLGMALGELVVKPDRRETFEKRIASYFRPTVSASIRAHFSEQFVRRDGELLDAEVAFGVLNLTHGYVFNMFVRDVTEKNAAEERLRQAQKMDAIGQLTGGVAHDFNNMLTIITGTIDILEAGVADRPELASIAKLINEAADRGAELTSRLLAFARKQPLQTRPTDVNDVIAESVRLLRPALGPNVEIDMLLEENLWSALIDSAQLSMAMVNLGINARDAMPNGGKLTLQTENVRLDQTSVNGDVEASEFVMIAVTDTGVGIPEEIRERVFEPFFTTKQIGKGTGLGLSMVYGFIKQSGGHVKLYSEEGIGTTIKLFLPRARAEELIEPATQAAIAGGDELILIVEDDALVRSYLTAQIQSFGYRTRSAANAAEALALIDDGLAFDLLFTDVIMPGQMNGRELAEEAEKRRPGLKVLFTSGFTEDAVIHRGRLNRGILLLAKPYRVADLARVLRCALDGDGLQPAARPTSKAS
jgi:PAS domain S-box-containing protein